MRSLRRPIKRHRYLKQATTHGIALLCAAALPLLAPSLAESQTMPHETTARIQYSYFKEWQSGNDDRMEVQAPYAMITAPLSESLEIEAGFVYDTLSGASPVYHDSLSGASRRGIQDDRIAADTTLTKHFERFSISVGGNVSSEEDYDSQGGSIATRIWSEDKNTVLLLGMNANHDRVGSSNNPDLDELHTAWGWAFGVTQVIDPISVIQSNLTLQVDDGYMIDPYKLGDNRPESRDRFAWMTRYVRYIEKADASLHLDYRFYADSWELLSHTIEASWYQPLDAEEQWLLRPRLRYYNQSDAYFYSDLDPIEVQDDRFYTADQRLGAFGGITAGLKLMKQFGSGYTGSIAYDFSASDGDWTIGSAGSPRVPRLYMNYLSLQIAKRF